MAKHKIAIIGGTGFDSIEGFTGKEVQIHTPYDTVFNPVIGERVTRHVDAEEGCIEGVADVDVLLVKRHGHGHTVPAAQVNHRANVYAATYWGAEYAIGITAVGALHPGIRVGTFVIPNRLHRQDPAPHELDFYGTDAVVHMEMRNVFTTAITDRVLYDTFVQVKEKDPKLTVLSTGKLVLINKNNSFSTEDESDFGREKLQGDIIGMTAYEALPCALLALPYAALALVVDRDNLAGKGEENQVSQAVVDKNVGLFKERVGRIVRMVAARTPELEEVLAQEQEAALRRLGNAVIGGRVNRESLDHRDHFLYERVQRAIDLARSNS